jgi:hypothetical protein
MVPEAHTCTERIMQPKDTGRKANLGASAAPPERTFYGSLDQGSGRRRSPESWA